MVPWRRPAVALLAGVGIALSACGGDEDLTPRQELLKMREEGASCAEIFDRRNEIRRERRDLSELLNATLREMGCLSSAD